MWKSCKQNNLAVRESYPLKLGEIVGAVDRII